MKTITLTDEEVQLLREILNSKISNYLDDFYEISSDEDHRVFNPKADLYKRIYNKIVAHIFKA